MEAPLSRVEAILQNILGADNILVPPGSQVEEILQAIYYNTEYEKNPESRVAEILLAIKNKGIYDGPVLSRVEDILIHKLNNIPYTKHKKEDLSRVEQLLLDWLEQGGGEEIIEYTGTFPMTILANGEPLLDYIISGNTVQSSTPTPENPIIPEGTGERTGNWLDFNQLKNAPSGTIGSITFSHVLTLQLKANTYYTMASNGTGSVSSTPADLYRSVYFNATTGESSVNKNNPVTVLTDSTGVVRIGFFSERTNAQQYLSGEAQLWINEGSEPLPYEPYGYKIPISSASTTTPVYLGEVESTRRIHKIVFDGTENWSISGAWKKTNTSVFYFPVSGIGGTSEYERCILSTHFASKSRTELYQDDIEGIGKTGSNAVTVRVDDAIATTVNDFKAWLRDNNITVWYVLATEETAVVNEPLMKIGDYADTLSYAQAGEDVPTNEKPTETVIDVPTSVKPSEGYLKYTEPTDGPTPKTQVLGTKNHEIYMTSNDEVYVLRR